MTDIIDRLRSIDCSWSDEGEIAAASADEIERLRAECDALKKDAARYQFIRAGGAYIEPHETGEIYVATDVSVKYYKDLRDLDMDIDEAITAAPKPEDGK